MKLNSLEEFDDFQPCFYETMAETEEEFFAPAPSEDIWKKFHLISSPPHSPEHVPSYLDTGLLFPRIPAVAVKSGKLKIVGLTDSLDDTYLNQTILCPDLINLSCLKSKLIQDCMWSGHNEAGENLDNCDSDDDSDDMSEKDIPSSKNNNSDKSVVATTTDCVDPSSVFPYPVSEPRDDNSEQGDIISNSEPEPEDDDEEIDVVTVERLQVIRRTVSVINKPTLDVVDGEFAAPRISPEPRIFSQKRKSVSMPNSPLPSAKRQRKSPSLQELKQVSIQLNMHDYLETNSARDSANSEDDDDDDDVAPFGGVKRTQHNVLERKRRNDLKYSFHYLRRSVPELSGSERSPKVTILRKAADFVQKLHTEGKKLQRTLDDEKRKNELLKERLKHLQSL